MQKHTSGHSNLSTHTSDKHESVLKSNFKTSKDLNSANNVKEQGRRCCWFRCIARINAFIWQNEIELLKSDHLKAAPCVSTCFLACLRIFISVILVIQTIFTVVEANSHDASFEFISQWNLFLITAVFTTMAVV